jgi:EAL domain-containing protein (putative c-di-GMP-specific phosphodiesterase class I)
MCVNLSARELVDPTVVVTVEGALRLTGLKPSCLILEISEAAMMSDTVATIANMRALKKLGVKLAVDDFGTGYSSLAYLQRFPIDILKIDKSFVDNVDGAATDAVLTQAIVELAHTMHLIPIAEGVERVEQAAALDGIGCEFAQGFYFAPPVDAEAFERLVQSQSGSIGIVRP